MSGYIFLDKLKKMTDYLEEDYAKTLQIKTEIFRITQPKSPTYSDVKIQNDNIRDKFGEYVELIEAMQIEKRLYLLEKSINDCKHIIRRKEEELRNSKDYDDKIYCLWFLDGKSVKQIGAKQTADFIRCTAWEGRAELIEKYVHKGNWYFRQATNGFV